MDKKLKLNDIYVYIPYCFCVVYMLYRYTVIRRYDDIPLDRWMIRGNYVPLLCSNAYFYVRYKKMAFYYRMKNLCLIRLGRKEYEDTMLRNSFLSTCGYIFVSYILAMLLYASSIEHVVPLVIFIAIHFVLFLMYECIFIYTIMKDKKMILMLLPVLLNLVIQFAVIQPLTQ